MPELPAQFAHLLDEAVAFAKKAGHESVTAIHLAAAMISEDRPMVTEFFGDQRVESIMALVEPSGSFALNVDLQPAASLLGAAASAPQELKKLVLTEVDELLERVAGGSSDGESMPAHDPSRPENGATSSGQADPARSAAPKRRQPSALPPPLASVARMLETSAGSPLIGRDDVVDQIITALARRTPQTPLIIGRSGGGRTSVLQALADRLALLDGDRPLASHRVVRIDAASIIARERGRTLQAALQAARSLGDAIVALDDLEVLTGLGWGQSVDTPTLTIIRSLLDDPDLPLVLVVEERFGSKLEVHDIELASRLHRIEVPPLSSAALLTIGHSAAAELAEHHGVQIPPEVIEQAALPAPQSARLAHPALLISRLDGAGVRASLRGTEQVSFDDLDLGTELEQPEIRSLDETLHARIVGQDVAIERVTGRLAVTRQQMDLRPERPDGVFLFVGPTGVGKTALALALSEALDGPESRPIRLDMSEYAQEWATSRLIGPPPGYVGSTEPSQWLTTRVAERPDAVLLLDEIEKAHPVVWNTFLQVFDAGRLTDSRGKEVDFSRTVIILTSNLGAADAVRPSPGFVTTASDRSIATERLLEAVRAALPPELFNRLDDVVAFEPLSSTAIHEIAAREVAEVVGRLRTRGLVLEFDDEAVEHLAETGYDLTLGARHLQRNLERLLLEPAARLSPGRYLVTRSDQQLRFTAAS